LVTREGAKVVKRKDRKKGVLGDADTEINVESGVLVEVPEEVLGKDL